MISAPPNALAKDQGVDFPGRRESGAQRWGAMDEVLAGPDTVFWITDPARRQTLFISPAYQEIWGRTCASLRARPETWTDAIRAQDRSRVLQAMQEKLALGTFREEYRIVRPDGSERWVRERAFPVHGADGALQRIVGFAEDITEIRQVQEVFLWSERMGAMGTLAGGLAHDLNNLLGLLLMVPAVLANQAGGEPERQILEVIERSVARTADMVRQLVILNRDIGGDRRSVQFQDLFRQIAGFMAVNFRSDIAVVHHAAPDLRPVLGDAGQLYQVLMNLCLHAAEAMPEGGQLSLAAANIALTGAELRAHAPVQAGDFVAVSVADTGEAIDLESIGRVFEPFFTTKPPGKGTGLGLAIALGIVRSHHGFITASRPPGRGTTFTVYLPAAATGVGSIVGPPEAGAPPRGNGELILLVDDDRSVMTTNRLILESHGYRVVTASNGAAAIAVFLESRDLVRLVLTDISMPVMGGVELTRALRSVEPKIKVVALSSDADGAELKALAFNEILRKPCPPRALLGAMGAQLGGATLTPRFSV